MPRRSAFANRSPREWGVRALIVVAALPSAYVSLTATLGSTLEKIDVGRSHSLAGGDGRITAALAQTYVGVDADGQKRAQADRLARLALRQDPTAVEAVSTLGINAQIRGNAKGAKRLFAYAEQLSRRDLQTQLWGIEDAVARGDIPGVLRHYDIALRTSRSAPDLLFPILASAISDPNVLNALVKTMAAKPGWGSSFVEYAAGGGADPTATATLLTKLRLTGLPVSELASAAVTNALLTKGQAEAAWRYYASVRPGTNRNETRDPRFTTELVHPTPFDWQTIGDAGISVSIQHGAEGGVVDFAAPSGIGGPLLQQMQVLSPGTYILQGHGSDIQQEERARPYWLLTCSNSNELGRIVLPNSDISGGAFGGTFEVPNDCPIQMLTLVARPSDAMAGTSGQIDHVRLRPTQRR